MTDIKEKYLALEKVENVTITLLPSVKKKAEKLSRKILGKKNVSGLFTYLINKEEQ